MDTIKTIFGALVVGAIIYIKMLLDKIKLYKLKIDVNNKEEENEYLKDKANLSSTVDEYIEKKEKIDSAINDKLNKKIKDIDKKIEEKIAKVNNIKKHAKKVREEKGVKNDIETTITI